MQQHNSAVAVERIEVAMEMDVVKKAVAAILTRPEYQLPTERNKVTRRAAEELLQASSEEAVLFEDFSVKLVAAVRGFCHSSNSSSSSVKSSLVEKSITSFHLSRTREVDVIWSNFYECYDTFNEEITRDEMMKQYTNQVIFEKYFITSYRNPPTAATPSVTIKSLTKDEANIVRYMSGFVPYKLLNKYKKMNNAKAAQYVECLSSMAVRGPDDFATYAMEWMEEVNRGGLFQVSDTSFELFTTIELIITNNIPNMAEAKRKVLDDSEVDVKWLSLSVDVDNEHKQELLAAIVDLWISSRGNSVTRHYMELYKKAKKKGTKRKKGLRKDMKAKARKKEEEEPPPKKKKK